MRVFAVFAERATQVRTGQDRNWLDIRPALVELNCLDFETPNRYCAYIHPLASVGGPGARPKGRASVFVSTFWACGGRVSQSIVVMMRIAIAIAERIKHALISKIWLHNSSDIGTIMSWKL